jgi:hypothetical protein
MPGELLASVTRVTGFGCPRRLPPSSPARRIASSASRPPEGDGGADELATLAPMEPGPILIVLPEETAESTSRLRYARTASACRDRRGRRRRGDRSRPDGAGPSAILVGASRGRALAFARGPR